jgi:hypothetical protein
MDADAIAAMFAEDRREWSALCAALDAHPDGALHDPESPSWTARDVYAHLARWIDHSTSDLEAALTRRGKIQVLEGSDDEINARWQAEDSGLSLAEARSKAQAAFDRRIAAIESVPAGRWNPALDAIAHADDAHHYRAHHGYIKDALT